MRKHFRPGNSIVACPLQLLKTVKRCRKGILESICQLLIAIAWLSPQQNRTIQISSTCQHAKKGYQYVPMINTLPHPNKALVFPCPLRQRVGQWQLRPLSYNVHQLLCRVWVCHVALAVSWELHENCLPKLGLTMIPQPEMSLSGQTIWIHLGWGQQRLVYMLPGTCCKRLQLTSFKAPATRRTRDLWVP